jgi:negative regulator of sigma E activity
MNEQEQVSQLSALFDGELPQQQAEMVIRRALRDDTLRASWDRYALIGACMRGEPLSGRLSVADRVQAQLAAERDHNLTVLPSRGANAGSGGSQTGRAWLGRGALGGAIAAGVAAVSIFVMREMMPVDGGAMLASNPAPANLVTGGAVDSEPAGYTTPGTNSPAQSRMVDASLGHYLVAHSEGAASALRANLDLAGGVALTEDQISALR